MGEGATACIAALFARLAMWKNSLRERPLARFVTTPARQTEQLYKLSNCGFQDYGILVSNSIMLYTNNKIRILFWVIFSQQDDI